MKCNCSLDTYDYESPEFHSIDNPMARKTHVCCECGESILPGQTYESASGKWDGDVMTYKTCLVCARIRDDYCWGGYLYGGLRETLWECLGLDYVSGEQKDAMPVEEA